MTWSSLSERYVVNLWHILQEAFSNIEKYAQAEKVSLSLELSDGRLNLNIADDVPGLCVHSMRATASTNALENGADIAKAQEWLGHANVSTTRLYDRRKSRPEDSPTLKVKY